MTDTEQQTKQAGRFIERLRGHHIIERNRIEPEMCEFCEVNKAAYSVGLSLDDWRCTPTYFDLCRSCADALEAVSDA